MTSRLSKSNSPKQYKLDAARKGQTSATPVRQVVEAAVDKTAKDGEPRFLYLKRTAPSCGQPGQAFLTTKFKSEREDKQDRGTQAIKVQQTQRAAASTQVAFLATYLRDLPQQTRSVQHTAQDLATQCTAFSVPCTPELLQQLKQLERAQQTQPQAQQPPRQTLAPKQETPKVAPRPLPKLKLDTLPTHESLPPTSQEPASASHSEESSLSMTSSSPQTERPVRKTGRDKPRLAHQSARRTVREEQSVVPSPRFFGPSSPSERSRRDQSLADLQDLFFPDTPESRRTPKTPPTPTVHSPTPSDSSAALQALPEPVVPQGAAKVSPPTEQRLAEPVSEEQQGNDAPSSEESPKAASDRPASTITTADDSDTPSKALSTPVINTVSPSRKMPSLHPMLMRHRESRVTGTPRGPVTPHVPDATPRGDGDPPTSSDQPPQTDPQ